MRSISGRKVLRESQRVYETHYQHVFDNFWQPTWGYTFECLETGELIGYLDHTKPIDLARGRRYKDGLAGSIDGNKVVYRGIKSYVHHYYVPPVIECGCGLPVELSDPMTNRCECDKFYNGGGELLSHPRNWGEETDERFDDSGNLVL